MQKLAFTLPTDQAFATAFADWVERNSGTVFITSVYDAAEKLYQEDKVVIDELAPGKVTANVNARGRGKANLTLTYDQSGVVIDCSCKYQKGPCKHTAAFLWVVDDQPDERVNTIAANVEPITKAPPAKSRRKQTKKKPATKAASPTPTARTTKPAADEQQSTPNKQQEPVAETNSGATAENKRKQRGKRSGRRGGRRREATPELTGEDLKATTETKLEEMPAGELIVEQEPLTTEAPPKAKAGSRGKGRNQKPSARKSRKQQSHAKPRNVPASKADLKEVAAEVTALASQSRTFEAYLEGLDRRVLVDLILRFAPAGFRAEHSGDAAGTARAVEYLAPHPTTPHQRPRPPYTEDDGSPEEAIALLNDRLSTPYEHGLDADRTELYQVRVGLAADYEGPKSELLWLLTYLNAIPAADTLRYIIQRRPRQKEQFKKALLEADPEAYQDYLDMEATA